MLRQQLCDCKRIPVGVGYMGHSVRLLGQSEWQKATGPEAVQSCGCIERQPPESMPGLLSQQVVGQLQARAASCCACCVLLRSVHARILQQVVGGQRLVLVADEEGLQQAAQGRGPG